MTPVEPGVKVPDSTVTSDASVTPEKVASSSKRTRARKADAPPKPRAKRPAPEPASDFTTSQLEDALAQILTLPAIPCAMVGDEWASNHFSQNGRIFAKNLAEQAEKNPTLRKWCIRIAQGEVVGTLAITGVMYFLPPLVHWGLIPLPNEARGMIPGMPPPKVAAHGDGTAASHMAEPGNRSNTSNGNQAGTRQERHTP